MRRILRIILFLGLVLTVSQLRAQVGIGTERPHPSAQLDVVARDKGILIPRIGLTDTRDRSTITGNQPNSLLVFNTNRQNDVEPGYYYWFNNRWVRLMASGDLRGQVFYDGQELYYYNDSGDKIPVDLGKWVQQYQIVTQLINRGEGRYTYYNEKEINPVTMQPYEDAQGVNFDIPGEVADNFEAVINHAHVVQLLVNKLKHTMIGGNVQYDPNQNKLYYLDERGHPKSLQLNTNSGGNVGEGSLTSLVQNPDGSLTYRDEVGQTTTIDLNTTTVTAQNGVFTFTDAKGTEIGTIDTKASGIRDKYVGKAPVQVQKTATDPITGREKFEIGVDTAQGTHLGVVREAGENPTVRINKKGELSVNLGALNAVKHISANYTVLATDKTILVDANGHNINITLPNPDGLKGKKYTIKKIDNNQNNYVNVNTTGGQIRATDGTNALYTGVPYTGWDLVSDGTQWIIVNKF